MDSPARERIAIATGLAVQLLPLTAASLTAASLTTAPEPDDGVWAVGASLPADAPLAHAAALDELVAMLRPAGAGASATRVAVSGPAGVGKTALVRTALAHTRAAFRHGWALDGASETALMAGLDQVARDLRVGRVEPSRVVATVRARLGLPDAVGWVLFIDDVAAGPFARHLPELLPNVGGCIVVASRVRTLADADGWAELALEPLADGPDAPSAPIAFLGALAAGLSTDADAVAVAAELGGLPLALAHAAEYTRTHLRTRSSTAWATYRARLAEQTATLGARARTTSRDVVPALRLTLEAVVADSPAVGPMLQLLQVIPPGTVGCPRALLAAAYTTAEPIRGATGAAAALEVLARGAIVGVDVAGHRVTVHPLLQAAMAAVAPCDEDHAAALCGHINALVYDGFLGEYGLMRQLLVLYETLLPWMATACSGCPERVHAMVATSLVYEYALDQTVEGRAALERACETVCRDRESVATRLVSVGNVFGERAGVGSVTALNQVGTGAGNDAGAGGASKQRILLERALVLHERIVGQDHVNIASTLHSLGAWHGARGDPVRQRVYLERALALLERHGRADAASTVPTLIGLANALGALGDLQRKRTLIERALALQERAAPLPPTAAAAADTTTASSLAATLNNLGNVYGTLSLPAKQKALLERALALNEQQLGPDHIEVATTLNNLGNAYGALGDAVRQKALLERALAIRERHYGPDHVKVAGTLTNLGNAYGALGDPASQRRFLERALAIYEESSGPGALGNSGGSGGGGDADVAPQQVLVTVFNLGMACRALRDFVGARVYLQQSFTLARSLYGPEHPTTRKAQTALARLPVDGDELGHAVASALSTNSPHGSTGSLAIRMQARSSSGRLSVSEMSLRGSVGGAGSEGRTSMDAPSVAMEGLGGGSGGGRSGSAGLKQCCALM